MVDVVDIFKYPTSKLLASYLLNNSCIASDQEPNEPVDCFPASSLQRGMIFHSLTDSQHSVYQDVFSYEIADHLNVDLFKKSIYQVCALHPMLHCCFQNLQAAVPLVTISQGALPDIEYVDLSEQLQNNENWKKAWIEREKSHPLNLNKAPLIRFSVHKISNELFHFGFTFHHAIMDGWSVASTVVEILKQYHALLKGSPICLPKLNNCFKDFVELESKAIENKSFQSFWHQLLLDYTPTILKPLSLPDDVDQCSRIQTYHVEIDNHHYDRLSN